MISSEISEPLSGIFNLSITTGKFITVLKIAKIIPIYKNKGSSTDVSNYRPIALLSSFDKIFEKLIHKRIMTFLDKKNIIYKRQFGFRKNHSTIHNLIALTEEIRKNLDKGNFSCGIFIDLQKAFDSVDHDILLKKLHHYGVRGLCNDWIRSYLVGRRQFVSVSGVKSTSKVINYGVPQGSVLGPLLFLIYVNDIQNSLIYSKSFIFADDTAALYSDKSLKRLQKRLNIDLKLLSHWLNANKIALNVSKTECILFKNRKQIVDYNLKIKLRGKRLFLTDHTKYLGVLVDKHLSWNMHLEKVAKTLRSTNGMIAKLRHHVPRKTIVMIYQSLFQSHVNYGLVVWGQNLPANNRITKLQKTAVRLMTFSPYNAHTKPLFSTLKIKTINDTLQLNNILLAHKILNGNVPIAIKDALNLNYLNTRIITRANLNRLLKRPEARTTFHGLYSINYRLVLVWNSLQTYSHKVLSTLSISRVKKIMQEFLSL